MKIRCYPLVLGLFVFSCGPDPIDLYGVANTKFVQIDGIEWKVSMIGEDERFWMASKADEFYVDGDHPKNHVQTMLLAIEQVTGCNAKNINNQDIAKTIARVTC